MDRQTLATMCAAAGGLACLAGAWFYARSHIRYVVGQSSFRVMLGGLTLRRIEFTDIDRITKPRRDLKWSETENWRNTFRDAHRLLVIERKSGRFRKLVVTPRLRYELRAQLRAAIAKATGATPVADEGDDSVE